MINKELFERFERVSRLLEGSAVKHDNPFRNHGMKMDRPMFPFKEVKEMRVWKGVRKWPR